MKRTTWIILAAMLVARSAADEPASPMVFDRDTSELRLRASVEAPHDVVTLGDIIDFSHADPRLVTALAAQPILSGASPVGEVAVTHPQVVARLNELGVNMARVLVSGSYRCRVRVLGGSEVRLAAHTEPAVSGTAATINTPASATNADHAPLLRTTRAAALAESTLADQITAFVREQWSSPGDTPEIEFERGRQEFLTLTSPPFDFKIRAAKGAKLGMREFKVTIQRDGRNHRNVSVFGHVRLVREVLVAAKPLNIGAFLKPDSVTIAKRVFESADDIGIQHAESIAGQRLQAFVPVGQMIRASDLKPVDMVTRSRPVSLFSDGAVGVRLTGTALDSGGLGETVRVRIGESRNSHRVVRGTVVGVSRVELMEES